VGKGPDLSQKIRWAHILIQGGGGIRWKKQKILRESPYRSRAGKKTTQIKKEKGGAINGDVERRKG